MRKYEIMYILNPEATNLDELESKLHQILEANGGKIEEHGKWGIKDLVYPINKKTKGYYGVLIVNTTSENIDEFVRISNIEQDVLRILVINTEKEKGYIQSTVYAKTEVKNDKPDRDRRSGNKKTDYKRHEQRSEGEEAKSENASTETKE
ncbi:30S ribosomal protein S6 [Spiroplasma endosymbiont of Ammophila pubescens]|uniref:30S ribosomal protein S6 n=1 Tax=Spiroplasma endosymbiont of Ammophila pubescens TaxID=3066315 RepID=UPI0032B2FB2B